MRRACTPFSANTMPHFRNCRKRAASVEVYEQAVLENCEIHGHDGIVVRTCGAASVRRCRLIDIQGTALRAGDTARVKVTDHTVMEGCTVGVNVLDSATVAQQDCMISGGDTAISVYGSDCTMTAKRVVAGGPHTVSSPSPTKLARRPWRWLTRPCLVVFRLCLWGVTHRGSSCYGAVWRTASRACMCLPGG